MAIKVPKIVKTLPPREDLRRMAERIGRHVRYYRGLYRDKRTPFKAKVLLGVALAYFFSPFDIIPDFVPVLGQLDDAIVVPFLFGLANRAVPEEVREHYRVKFLED